MDRAIEAVTGKQEKDRGEEGRELGDAHLAARHREVLVVNRSQTTDIALYGDVVRRVDESHRGFFVLHVDLWHREAGHLEAEVEFRFSEKFELLTKQSLVPGRVFREPVVGDLKSFDLSLTQMVDRDRGYFGQAEL